MKSALTESNHKMKTCIYSPTKGYLDGFDAGFQWIWTTDKMHALWMPHDEAEMRLGHVLETVPDAVLKSALT